MRIAVANAGILGVSMSRRHLRSALFACGSSAFLLVGCATNYAQQSSATPGRSQVPLPRHALLAPPKVPACTLETSALKSDEPRAERTERGATVGTLAAYERSGESGGAGGRAPTLGQPNHMLVEADPNAGLAQRIKLEYERNCFKQAELRVREQLLQLQTAIGKTIRSITAADRAERSR